MALIAGAAPGAITGVVPHDPADVEQWLAPYIARGEPQWSVDYLEVGRQTVMLITVEAPQWGDVIFTLRKGYERAQAGVVFVRGNGKTEQASPQDVRRLTERAKRANLRLNVGVAWRRPPRLAAVIDLGDSAKAFAAREAERLRPGPEPPSRAFDFGASFLRDTRSRDAYRDELAAYCAQAPRRFALLVEKAIIDGRLSTIAPELVNSTEINFPQTQVTLRLPAGIRAYFDADEIENLLRDVEPPLPWGKKTLGSIYPSTSYVTNLLSTIRPDGRKIECGEELLITLPPVDVRPGTRHELLPVELVLPPNYAGATVEIHWRATSTGAAGDAEGTLEAEVSPELMAPALLLEGDGDD
jgi:hypothetical protein